MNYEDYMKTRPHLVILGAGASVAAIPNGDKNGMKTSVMKGFIDKLNMRDLIADIELKTKSDNLEDIYSEMSQRHDCKDLLEVLENKIYNYFLKFEIPEEPTIYDMLLLSLRPKDCIATFNWDPLLLQAYQRVVKITKNLPELLFLHGNVMVGTCDEHKRGGLINSNCPLCNKRFKPVKLLYPVDNKDYTSGPFIRDNWNAVKHYMKFAYVVTIFGYSAPKTDRSAIDLLKSGWGDVNDRNLEEFEIIDIRPEQEVVKSWSQFIHSHHYGVFNSFFKSSIARFPRRSCDATFDRLMNVRWLDGSKGLKEGMTFKDLEEYFQPILEEELNHNGGFNIFCRCSVN